MFWRCTSHPRLLWNITLLWFLLIRSRKESDCFPDLIDTLQTQT
uniref:Uncharacterized protein n=1 Tax=Arundo donax TaxID=35708 RepID=A0A0A8ZE96_ARUDO